MTVIHDSREANVCAQHQLQNEPSRNDNAGSICCDEHHTQSVCQLEEKRQHMHSIRTEGLDFLHLMRVHAEAYQGESPLVYL